MKFLSSLLIVLTFVWIAPNALAADPYAHTNSKGKTYYLFSKDVPLKNSDKTQTIYYFAKDPKNPKGTPLEKVPDDKMVSETKTGMLVLKKKAAKDTKEKEKKKEKQKEKKD